MTAKLTEMDIELARQLKIDSLTVRNARVLQYLGEPCEYRGQRLFYRNTDVSTMDYTQLRKLVDS